MDLWVPLNLISNITDHSSIQYLNNLNNVTGIITPSWSVWNAWRVLGLLLCKNLSSKQNISPFEKRINTIHSNHVNQMQMKSK